jgi:hypothetical protein
MEKKRMDYMVCTKVNVKEKHAKLKYQEYNPKHTNLSRSLNTEDSSMHLITAGDSCSYRANFVFSNPIYSQ